MNQKDNDFLNNPSEETVEQLRSMLRQRQSEEDLQQDLSDAQDNIRLNRFIEWLKEKFSHKNNTRLQSLGDVETEINSNPQTNQHESIPKAKPLYPFLEEETPIPITNETTKEQTEDATHYLRDVPILNGLIRSDMETSDTLKRLIAEFDEQDSQDEVENSDNDSPINDEEFEPDFIQNDPYTGKENQEEIDPEQSEIFNVNPFEYSDRGSKKEIDADDWQSLIDDALKGIEEKSNEDDFVFPFILEDADSSDKEESSVFIEEPPDEKDVEPLPQEDEVLLPEQEKSNAESIDTPTTETDQQQADIISSLRENLKEEYDRNEIEDIIPEETQIDSVLSGIKTIFSHG